MSAETIKEFLVGLGFKVDEAGLAKFSEGIASASLRVTALATAATAAAAGIVASVQHIAAEYDQLDKLATQFRTTADAVDEFIDTAKILGLSDEKSIESLKNLDRAIVDTSMGMGRAKLVFEDLGIKVTDTAGKLKPTTEVMAELANKFKDMERGKQLRIMERLGLDPALLKVFNGDLAAISAELQEIDKAANFDFETAIVESKAFMQIWRQMQQEIEKWKMLFSKAFESVAVKLMPKFRAQIKSITDSMVAFRKKVMENMPKAIEAIMPIINIIMRVAEAFIKIVARIASGAMTVIGWFLKLNEATGGWAGYILAAAAAWKYLNLSFLATPLGMLLSLAAVVALLIDDFLTFKEGGDSLIDWGSGFGIVMQGVTAALTGFLAYIALSKAAVIAMTVATNAWTAATAIMNGIMAAARTAVLLFNLVLYANPIGLVIAAVVALIAIIAALIVYWDDVSAAFGRGAAALLGAWQGVKDWFMGFFDWIMGKFSTLAEWGGKITGFFGGGGDKAAPALAPSPQAQAAINGGGQNVNQQTQIVVQGSSDPAATARAVSGEQGRVNADMARNMRGAAR
jgi:hypothetical protein